jgi:tetratricopeptide (TPR) repeat protein
MDASRSAQNVASPANIESSGIQWLKYYEALEVFQKTNRKITMIYFSHDRCQPCDMMEKWTFSDPKVVEAAKDFIPVKIESGDEAQVAKRFGIETYPMIVFARLDGGEMDRKAGYRDSDFLLRWIANIKANRNTISSVQKQLDEKPDDVDLLLRQAQNYLDADEIESSKKLTQKAAEIAPENSNVKILNVLYHLRLDELDVAMSVINEVLKADEQNEEALRLRTMVWLKKAEKSLRAHEFVEATQQYEEVLRIEPDNFTAHMGLGQALRETGDMDKALAEFKKAEAIRPDSAVPHVAIGDVYQKLGNDALAEQRYTKAIAIERRYEPPYFRLMELYEKNGRRDDLMKILDKALPIEPAGAHNEIAWLLATSKYPQIFDPLTAEKHAQQAVELDPDPMYLDTLAEAYYAQGKYGLAISIIKEAIAAQPDDLQYYEDQLEKFQKARGPATEEPVTTE